ncbi:FAD/NAD(P)-binding domain-containing protein [Durotheca rogersii]|uniref:FAD/NAD(P)-binding domain-containing protein n=1 Tax=Durotheca rogersii TaxID=419775 RepID=UPI0022209006|nr:FAD/NAD(P)-binding domain-containing protein [Durotheca rogersii]KAI5861415.1 FAD/NAD(P)-binding domain-containing protein [Durotheca rogersii]
MARIRVLISGAGIAGNALAFWLVKLGHEVTVVEKFPVLRATGLQIDLRGHGIEVLRRMGLEREFRELSAPEQGLQIVDGTGRQRALFPANKPGDGGIQSFTSEFEIMRGDLCRLFHDATADRARCIFGTSIASLQQENMGGGRGGPVDVTFENGKTERFDLVVGADGMWSHTRRLLFGPDTPETLRPLGGFCIAYFTMPRAIQEGEGYLATAYMAPGRRAIMTRRHRPDAMQVYLPCRSDGGRLARTRRGDVAGEKAAFAESLAGAGWQADEIVAAMWDADDFYCEHLRLVTLPTWARGRAALVGDAAYCPSANTGMGTTCGVVGAYVLAGEIGRHCGRGEHDDDDNAAGADGLEAALAAYERTFRPYVDKVTRGVAEDASVWNMLPSLALGVGIMHAVLGLASYFRLDFFHHVLREKRVQGWDLPDYEEMVGRR